MELRHGEADGGGRRSRPTAEADGGGRRSRPTAEADGGGRRQDMHVAHCMVRCGGASATTTKLTTRRSLCLDRASLKRKETSLDPGV